MKRDPELQLPASSNAEVHGSRHQQNLLANLQTPTDVLPHGSGVRTIGRVWNSF